MCCARLARVSSAHGQRGFASCGRIIALFGSMFAILHALGMFVADMFKSRCRLEAANLLSPLSTQYRLEAGANSTSIARQRPGIAGLDDPDFGRAARFGPGGEAGDDPAVASLRLQGLLALEIPKAGGEAQMLIFGEAHLRRILTLYASYYNELRTHLSLRKDAPLGRAVQRYGTIAATPILSGLHHRYARI
jgi:hypothetical protein